MAHMYNVPGIVCNVCCSSLTQFTDVPTAIVNFSGRKVLPISLSFLP